MLPSENKVGWSGEKLGDKGLEREHCESFSTTLCMPSQEPSCFFTARLLIGLLSVVKDRCIKESKCLAVGDPYCEWGSIGDDRWYL